MNKFRLEFEKPILELEDKINELERLAENGDISLDKDISRLRKKADKLRQDIYSRLNRWQCVQLARHPQRPYTLDYLARITTDFVELHGDRNYRDDNAIVAGLGMIGPHRVAIIGHQKGRSTRENLFRNFAMPNPEGYRKAQRVMRLAEKFGLPVITLIDTPGAYPGLGAEERGQASAIAESLMNMAQLKTPIIAVIIGEGGSGGALALGVADRVFLLQYSIYSVISPEGCASILYRDASHAQEAAEAMKLTANDLLEFGLIDKIIDEPVGGAHKDVDLAAELLSKALLKALPEVIDIEPEERVNRRIRKYAEMGRWLEK